MTYVLQSVARIEMGRVGIPTSASSVYHFLMESVEPIKTDLDPAVEFSCNRCSKLVRVCRSCWRNDQYCSELCAHEASVERKRRNQSKYSKTEGGRLSQAKRQRTYRAKKKSSFQEY